MDFSFALYYSMWKASKIEKKQILKQHFLHIYTHHIEVVGEEIKYLKSEHLSFYWSTQLNMLSVVSH